MGQVLYGFALALDLYNFVRYSNIVVGIVDAWKSHKVFTMTEAFLKLKRHAFDVGVNMPLEIKACAGSHCATAIFAMFNSCYW